jgi:hypothetical protein
VSTPLRWEELRSGLRPRDFGIAVALERIAQHGDLFAPVLEDPRPPRRPPAVSPRSASDHESAALDTVPRRVYRTVRSRRARYVPLSDVEGSTRLLRARRALRGAAERAPRGTARRYSSSGTAGVVIAGIQPLVDGCRELAVPVLCARGSRAERIAVLDGNLGAARATAHATSILSHGRIRVYRSLLLQPHASLFGQLPDVADCRLRWRSPPTVVSGVIC